MRNLFKDIILKPFGCNEQIFLEFLEYGGTYTSGTKMRQYKKGDYKTIRFKNYKMITFCS